MGIKHAAEKAHGEKGFAAEWNADHVIDGSTDFNGEQAVNFVFENSITPPVDPQPGQIYYNTAEKAVYIWDGTIWVLFGGSNVSIVPPDTITVSESVGAGSSWRCTGGNVVPAGKKWRLWSATVKHPAATDCEVHLGIYDSIGVFRGCLLAGNVFVTAGNPADPTAYFGGAVTMVEGDRLGFINASGSGLTIGFVYSEEDV